MIVKKKQEHEAVRAVVDEEEQLLSSVHAALARYQRPRGIVDYDAEMIDLRDAMAEEKLPDDQAMIVEQLDRLAAIASTRARYVTGRVDPASPYFGHLRLCTDSGQEREILLGRQAFFRAGIRIVDWRDAPISRVFYRYREGEPFNEEIAGRDLSGQVAVRRTVTIVDGKLLRVSCPQGTFLHTAEGWQEPSGAGAALRGGAGKAARPDTAVPVLGGPARHELRADKRLPEIAALLDRNQFGIISSPDTGLVVIRGSAGSGKTTVALHRLAYLSFQDPERYRPKRMLVAVFNLALARYISQVLPALGVVGVPVTTLGEWAGEMCRRHFRGITREHSQETPAAVVRFKTHRLLIPMLEEAARAVPKADPVVLFDELFTDRGWLRQGVSRHAPGSFSATQIGQIHGWCTRQHFLRADAAGQEEDERPCYDEADDMILLRLQQLLHGPLLYSKGHKLAYDHLVVDEAEDFSPLELQVLLQQAKEGSVSLAGDVSQRISENDFSDWDEVLSLLPHEPVQVSPLQVSYRCTRQIMEFAREVLGPLAPPEPLRAERSGEPVELLRCSDRGAALTFLGDALTDLAKREPLASVAVLAKDPEQAGEAYQALRRLDLPAVRWVQEQDFSFGPAVEVSDIAQTKGLEFDYVVLLNVDRANFPDTPGSRQLLYVGATRAVHQLWLLGWERPSPLIPARIKPRLAG